jgi:hypothetical protein
MRGKLFSLWFLISLLCSGCLSSNLPRQTSTPAPLEITGQPTSGVVVATELPVPATSTPFVIETQPPSYQVINEENGSKLTLLHQWDVENIFYRITTFWFSDSNQFIVPTRRASMDGIQSFEVTNFLTTWFAQTGSSEATTVTNDQVVTYQAGLLIFNKQGVEVQTLKVREKNSDCNEGGASHMVAIPGTDLIITGHQHNGDITTSYGSSRLLIWDKMRDSCEELFEDFTGRISSLSAGHDGDFISYSVITSTINTTGDQWIVGSTTHIFDLKNNRETCHLNGFLSLFSNDNRVVVYDTREDAISLSTPLDCVTQLKFKTEIDLLSLAISPTGDLLAGASENHLIMWSLRTGKKIHEITFEASLNSWPLLGFSPDGRFLVLTNETSSTECQVMLWGIPDN